MAVAIYMIDSVVIDLLAIPIIIYGAIVRFGAYGRIAAENDELDVSGKFMVYKNIQQTLFILLCGASDAMIAFAIVYFVRARPDLAEDL